MIFYHSFSSAPRDGEEFPQIGVQFSSAALVVVVDLAQNAGWGFHSLSVRKLICVECRKDAL